MILQTEANNLIADTKAFTLIELILVMTILLVAVSMTIPSLANFFRGRSLDSEARRLLALTRQGQSRAVSEGVPMILWMDTVNQAYGLEEEAGYTDNDSKAVDFTLDKDLRIEVLNRNTRNITISHGMSSNPGHRNLPVIRFLPDGFMDETSPQTMRLLDRGGAAISLIQSFNKLNYEIGN